MSLEQALKELEKSINEFASLGDANYAIKNNKELFFKRLAKVSMYYNYVMNNTQIMSDEWFEANNIVDSISYQNPSFEEWIEMIMLQKFDKNQKDIQDSIDISEISGPIESLVSEIKMMQSWDPEYVADIEWQLGEYQKLLIANQSLFSLNAYRSLMDDINVALGKIGKFNNMINSDLMQSIVKM